MGVKKQDTSFGSMKEREKDVGWLLRQTSGFYHRGLIFENSLEQLFDIQ